MPLFNGLFLILAVPEWPGKRSNSSPRAAFCLIRCPGQSHRSLRDENGECRAANLHDPAPCFHAPGARLRLERGTKEDPYHGTAKMGKTRKIHRRSMERKEVPITYGSPPETWRFPSALEERTLFPHGSELAMGGCVVAGGRERGYSSARTVKPREIEGNARMERGSSRRVRDALGFSAVGNYNVVSWVEELP